MTTADPRPAQSLPEAIFIVGVSRSGTTLMRKIVGASSLAAVAHENHFLGHLLPGQGMRHRLRDFGDLRDDENVRRFVAALYDPRGLQSSRLRPTSRHWRWIVERVPRDEFLARLLATDRTERAVFATVMRVYADHYGKPVMGEKTPAHLRYVPTLLTWFPAARVIHMIRDPRAVYVSELRRRRRDPVSFPYRLLVRSERLLRLYLLVQTTAAWLDGARRLAIHRRRFPGRYAVVRFEDLVTRPEATIRELCSFLDLPYEAGMLDQIVVSRGARVGEAGFDAGASDRWRGEIGPRAERWLRLTTGRTLRDVGYPS